MRLLFVFFAAVLTLLAASVARADDVRRAGTVRVVTAVGGRGPIDLRPTRLEDQPAYAAELSIVNDGKEPLVVSRIAVRGDAADPRVPSKVTARLAEGSLPVTVPPGGSRRAVVQWTPDGAVRARQLFGHVVVTTSDEHTGEVAMGVRAQVPGLLGPLEGRILSLMIGIPLLAAIATFLLRLAGRRDDRTPHILTVVALSLQTVLAAYIHRGFVADLSRVDGNDGLQFVEQGVWIRAISAEIHLGVDGIGVTALFVASIVTLLVVLRERNVPRGAAGYHAALLVLDAALVGAITAMDGLLFVLFASIMIVTASLLVGTWGGDGRRSAALRLAIPGFGAVLLLVLAFAALAKNAEPTFLVDGAAARTTFSIPELSRVAFGQNGATVFGLSLVKVCFVLVLIASLFLLAAFPCHGWLSDVLVEAPPAAGVLVATALPAVGVCALLRVGCAVLPDGLRWASGIVVALGAISAAYGALSTLGQTDLRRMAASATTTQAGFVLLGAGSLTPQGLSGAIVLGSTRAIATGVFLLLAAAIHERARTTDVTRLGGVASQMPGWAMALAAAGLAQAGILGLGGAWGPVLALLGVLSGYAPLAIAAAVALVVIAAAHLAAVSRIAFGPLDPAWEKSELLEPFGGKFPDLTAGEWMSVAPLALIVILLGVWPSPVIASTTGVVRDLSNAVSPPGPDKIALATGRAAAAPAAGVRSGSL